MISSNTYTNTITHMGKLIENAQQGYYYSVKLIWSLDWVPFYDAEKFNKKQSQKNMKQKYQQPNSEQGL